MYCSKVGIPDLASDNNKYLVTCQVYILTLRKLHNSLSVKSLVVRQKIAVIFDPNHQWAGTVQSAKRVGTGGTVGGSNSGRGQIFRTRFDVPGDFPASSTMDTGSLAWGKVPRAWR